ncbi:flavin reductase family protein [Streptomyces fuscichromogenes]|uniref:Flavodoxin n=1 Tax=Streptomyces fuscichromogenes TaxID=1324013 RepID=A0A917XG86_9ACTN|nr:iron-sulfur cluster-binding domain-containing protein [Streptomyces fuscichromogenes]GGN22600.1 flavodoxin [Streptomyces fuscichromogenes]
MSLNVTRDWQVCTVTRNERIATAVRAVSVRFPQAPPDPVEGGHLDVQVMVNDRPEVRSYSVVRRDPDDPRVLVLGIQAAADSRGGSLAMHRLAPGSRIRATQPLVTFPYLPSERPTRLLAGGIGVTALAAMADTAARRPPAGGYRVTYLARSRARMAFLADLTARHGDLLDVHITDEDTALDVPEYVRGCPPDTVLYMCGPLSLIDAVRTAWSAGGRDPQDCRFETFGTTGRFPAGEFIAHVPSLGLTVTVDAGRSLLEAFEGAGAEVLADCRKGECGICRIPVLAVENGVIDHRDVFLSTWQQETDAWICPCVSRVHADPGGPGVVHVDLP